MCAMTVGELNVRLNLELQRLDAQINQANAKIARMGKSWHGEVGKAAKRINAALATIGAGASVAGLISFGKQCIDLGGQIVDLSYQAGIGTDAFQNFRAAAMENGATGEQVADMFAKMRKSVQEAAEGNKTLNEAFDRLNLNAKALKSLAPETQFELVARAVSNASDKQQAYNAAADIFGAKIAPKMMQFIDAIANGGAEKAAAAIANVRLTKEQLKTLDDAGDKLARIWDNIKLIGAQGIVGIFDAGSANDLAQIEARIKMLEKLKAEGAVTYTVSGDTAEVQSALKNFEAIRDRILGVSDSIDEVAKSLGQFGAGNIDLFKRPQVKNEDGSVSTVRSMGFNDGSQEVLIPTVARDGSGILDDQSAIDQYYKTGEYLGKFKSIEEANAYAEKLHKQQEAYYSQSIESLQAQQAAAAEAARIEQINADVIKATAEANKEATAAEKDRAAEQEKLFDAMRREDAALNTIAEATRRMIDPSREYTAQIEDINRALAANKLRSDEAAAAIDKIKTASVGAQLTDFFGDLDQKSADNVARITEESEKAKDAARELGMTFSSAFEDAIVGGEKFSDVLRSLAQDILKLFVRKSVTEPLMGSIASGLGSIFSGLGFAGGGRPPLGKASLVGEDGPELFVPDAAGTIVSNDKLNSAAGSFSTSEFTSVTVVQNFAAGVSQSQLLEALRQTKEAAQAGVMSAIGRRRGGFSSVALA